MKLKLISSILKGILISLSIPFFTIFLPIFINFYIQEHPFGLVGILLFIVINFIIVSNIWSDLNSFLNNDKDYKKNIKYFLLLLPFFLCCIVLMIFSIAGVFAKEANFLYPFFVNLSNMLSIFFCSFYIYFFFAIYKKEKIFSTEIKKITKAIIIFFFSLIGFFLCLSTLASNISIIRKFFELEIWDTKALEYPMLLFFAHGFSFYIFSFFWTLYRWYCINQMTDKKVSQVPFKLIITILNYPLLVFCYWTFKNHYFTPEYPILKGRYELFLPFAYIIVIGTPIFQVYIWFFHEKVVDKIVNKINNKLSHWWQKRKAKKLS